MIYKRDLVDAINGISHDLFALSVKLHDLESGLAKINNRVIKLENSKCPCKVGKNILEEEVRKAAGAKVAEKVMSEAAKEKKKEVTKIKKSTNAKKQPRSKDGKFTKKK